MSAVMVSGSDASVLDVLLLRAGFNTTIVILGATLLGIAAGVVGVFALLRQRSLVADALSHATLPGIAFAFLGAAWLGFDGRSVPVLLAGATLSAVLGVVCIQLILRYSRVREDAAIGIVLSVFFGVGVVGLSVIQSEAGDGSAGIKGFIFGQAATMQPNDVVLMGAIALVAIVAAALLHKEFALVCFDDAFARVEGWPVSLIDLLMLALVVVVTVAGVQAVGLILVVSLLIIPPVAARFWTERVWKLIVISGLIGAMSGYLGAVLSALYPGLPGGAVIVLSAGALFIISLLCAPARGVVARTLMRFRVRVRISMDHALEVGAANTPPLLSRSDLDRLARLRGWSGLYRAFVVRALRLRGQLGARVGDGFALTSSGAERGRRVARNHALWTKYLVTHADVAPSHVDWSVDQVEHVLSDEIIEQLEHELARDGVGIPIGAPA